MNAWLRVLASIFRFWNPLQTRPRLLIFLVIIVIGVGGIGVWIPLGQLLSGATIKPIEVYRCFAAYVIAIAITSFAEFVIEGNQGDRTLTLILVGFVLAACIPAAIIFVGESLCRAKICTWISSIFTLWLWLVALADRQAFEEEDPQQAIGGAI